MAKLAVIIEVVFVVNDNPPVDSGGAGFFFLPILVNRARFTRVSRARFG